MISPHSWNRFICCYPFRRIFLYKLIFAKESISSVLNYLIFRSLQAKDLKQYERDHKTIDDLEDEDKFLLQLTKVERLEQKLNIMLYMTTFQETLNTITPVCKMELNADTCIYNV